VTLSITILPVLAQSIYSHQQTFLSVGISDQAVKTCPLLSPLTLFIPVL